MFNVMPFGLRNAPATFQRLMDDVLRDCTNFVHAYIEDVAIFSMTWIEHIYISPKNSAGIITREGLTIQLQKTQLATQTCNFLGHIVGHNTISPQAVKIAALKEFRQPMTKTDVRAFLGWWATTANLLTNFSLLTVPLLDLTKRTVQIGWLGQPSGNIISSTERQPPLLSSDGCIQPWYWCSTDPSSLLQ